MAAAPVNIVQRIDTTHVVKLNNANYELWKLQISLILKSAKLWDVVSGTSTRPTAGADVIAAWDELDIKARALMVPTLNEANANHITPCTSSKEMWDKLENIHSDSILFNQQQTLAAFLNYKMKPNSKLVDAYTEVESLARSLNQIGLPTAPAMVIMKIVTALPNENIVLKKAWASVAPGDQTMENLLARLRQEDNEMKIAAAENKKKDNGLSKPFQSRPANQGDRKAKIKELKKRTKCNKC